MNSKGQVTRRAVLPTHLCQSVMEENHCGPFAGHFSGDRMYRTLRQHWWWEGMYSSCIRYARNCPECTVVTGGGRNTKPPLYPIPPVERPFQIIGVDIMELPCTRRGNRYVLVFQVSPIPDQKSLRIVKILVEEIVPLFGVPEALLSDRGTNLLSHLMLDVCKLLGTKKLNTTAYHPQCDGMVERFNRTLKPVLRKHATTFGLQWDEYLYGLV